MLHKLSVRAYVKAVEAVERVHKNEEASQATLDELVFFSTEHLPLLLAGSGHH